MFILFLWEAGLSSALHSKTPCLIRPIANTCTPTNKLWRYVILRVDALSLCNERECVDFAISKVVTLNHAAKMNQMYGFYIVEVNNFILHTYIAGINRHTPLSGFSSVQKYWKLTSSFKLSVLLVGMEFEIEIC